MLSGTSLRPHSMIKDNKIDLHIETQTHTAHIRVWVYYPGETLSLECLRITQREVDHRRHRSAQQSRELLEEIWDLRRLS
jgi:hypothetical protein